VSSANGSHGQASRARPSSRRLLVDQRARRDEEVKAVWATTRRQADEQVVLSARARLLDLAYGVRNDELRSADLEREPARLDTECLLAGGQQLSGFEAWLYGPAWVTGLIAVDLVLLSASTHEFASAVYGAELPLPAVAPISIAIAAAELALAGGLARARGAGIRNAPGSRLERLTLGSLAGGLAVALPMLGAAPFLVDGPAATGFSDWLLSAGALTLGMVFHFGTLFRGAVIIPALRRAAQTPRRWKLAAEARRREASARTCREQAPAELRVYEFEVSAFKEVYQSIPDRLLITEGDMALVREAVDGEIEVRSAAPVESTEHSPPPPQTPGPAAAAESDDDSAGEADYLRKIIDGRLRDADGEIR